MGADEPMTTSTRIAAAKPIRWRHWPSTPDRGESVQLRGADGGLGSLAERHVAIFGVGAVGGRTLEALVRVGVGNFLIVDPDHYGADSWVTQPAVPTDEGRPKAWALARRARRINPQVGIRAGFGLAQDVPLRLLRQADVFLAAGDNRELPVWAGVMAAAHGKPLIQGAVDGESWTAFVRGYDLRNPESACPACALSKHEWANLSSRFGCDWATSALARAQGQEPTRTLPMVCGTAAQLLASEALKWLMHQGRQALAGEELALCLRSHRSWRTTLPRNPSCRCPHSRWKWVELNKPAPELTLRMLAEQLDDSDRKRPQVRGERPWISFVLCRRCGRKNPGHRFGSAGTEVGDCSCGETLIASPVGMHSVLPQADRWTCFDRPLTELGIDEGEAIGIMDGEHWTYFTAATVGPAALPART